LHECRLSIKRSGECEGGGDEDEILEGNLENGHKNIELLDDFHEFFFFRGKKGAQLKNIWFLRSGRGKEGVVGREKNRPFLPCL